MKWIACMVLAAAGCQGEREVAPAADDHTTIVQLPRAPVTDAYRADIATLCDVVELSGADGKPRDERWPIIAMWLGPNIKTEAAHDYLVAIQPLRGEPKAAALDLEARRVGLERCALADEWRQSAAAPRVR